MSWLWAPSPSPPRRAQSSQKILERQLRDASSCGDVDQVQTLLMSGVDVNARGNQRADNAPTALLRAASCGHVHVTRELLAAGADVHAADTRGKTALHQAAQKGYVDIVALLLQANANVEAIYDDGYTALRDACWLGHVEIVRLLLSANARVDSVDEAGRTPLHWASMQGHVEIVELLLQRNASVETADNNGDTPLHVACSGGYTATARVLLDAGASVETTNNNGHKPLHSVIALSNTTGSRTVDAIYQMLRVLASHGAKWDDACDAMVVAGMATKHAPTLRVCLQLWARELAEGSPLTEIPMESIHRGCESTQTYIHELLKSTRSLRRHKVCVVGPSHWGKTSLIKSLTSRKPSLEHLDERTIGIDLVPTAVVQQPTQTQAKTIHHEITFWDFAGQEAYRAAHALFYSRRTLYLVCVDLQAYSAALGQAQLCGDDEDHVDRLMDGFVKAKILKWIRAIFLRQVDAQFVLVATKSDVVKGNKKRINRAKRDLMRRLQRHVAKYTRQIDRELSARAKDELGLDLLRRLQQLKMQASNMVPHKWIVVSCQTVQSACDANDHVLGLVVNESKQGFEMPEMYARVLASIVAMRVASEATRKTQLRVDQSFMDIEAASDWLVAAIAGLDHRTSRSILQTLHDLGDVLWYDDHGTTMALAQRVVVLDPLLMIEFIRQVINHKHTGEKMPHATLRKLPFWIHLDTEELHMQMMKQVLQHFQLVYPTMGQMQWDSDLMVPVYWRTNAAAYTKSCAGRCDSQTQDPRGSASSGSTTL